MAEKSQTTQGKKGNLEEFQNPQKKLGKSPKRARIFSCVTYIGEKGLNKAILDHQRQVRAFAYIMHDKDENEPHIHLLLRTYDSWTDTQIAKWFKGRKDAKGEECNTFVEVANDIHALKEYMTHSDEESRAQGKFEYSESDIRDFGLWDIVSKKDSYDDTMEIVNTILRGVTQRELLRRYGRKYLYHMTDYQQVCSEIRQEEGYKEAKQRACEELGMAMRISNDTDIADFFGVTDYEKKKPRGWHYESIET